MASSTPLKHVRLPVDIVHSMTTIISTDVHHDGMASVSHITAANTKIEITLCCTGLRPSMPKDSVGSSAMMIDTIAAMTAFMYPVILNLFLCFFAW